MDNIKDINAHAILNPATPVDPWNSDGKQFLCQNHPHPAMNLHCQNPIQYD